MLPTAERGDEQHSGEFGDPSVVTGLGVGVDRRGPRAGSLAIAVRPRAVIGQPTLSSTAIRDG